MRQRAMSFRRWAAGRRPRCLWVNLDKRSPVVYLAILRGGRYVRVGMQLAELTDYPGWRHLVACVLRGMRQRMASESCS